MEFTNHKRTHDDLYLNDDRYKDPKEYFKFSLNIINSLKYNNHINLLDIGCAAGDYLKFLSDNLDLNLFKLSGADISEELLKACKKKLSKAKYIHCDFGKSNLALRETFKEKYEIITMFGVHSCFDNLDWVENLSFLLKTNGTAIIFGIFNPYPFDVLMRVKRSDSNIFQSGWNVHSIKSIQKKCKEQKMNLEIINYQPELTIQKDEKDFLRTWTIKLEKNKEHSKVKGNYNNQILIEDERETIYTNATRIIHDYFFCKLTKL